MSATHFLVTSSNPSLKCRTFTVFSWQSDILMDIYDRDFAQSMMQYPTPFPFASLDLSVFA